MNRKYLKLFENCQIITGENRAIVCDLQRNDYVLIPLDLASLFDKDKKLEPDEIRFQLDNDSIHVFNDYLSLLKEKEFVFSCSEEELPLFPDLSNEFAYPAIATNMIVDYNKNSKHDFQAILKNFIISANCRHLELRFFDIVDFKVIDGIMAFLNRSLVKSIQIYLKESQKVDYTFIIDWVKRNKKILKLVIHSSTENIIMRTPEYGFGAIVKIKQKISSSIHCGLIHPNYFNTQIKSYTESLHHNSCLNRKISIDVNGDIKNCPSMPESYGNIRDTSLEEALSKPGFKKYWNITKDDIEVCKDCEFRYICTDCRAYTERTKFNDNIDLSKPLKCGYNPYTNEWAEWSKNPLKQKAIEYYGMEELTKKGEA